MLMRQIGAFWGQWGELLGWNMRRRVLCSCSWPTSRLGTREREGPFVSCTFHLHIVQKYCTVDDVHPPSTIMHLHIPAQQRDLLQMQVEIGLHKDKGGNWPQERQRWKLASTKTKVKIGLNKDKGGNWPQQRQMHTLTGIAVSVSFLQTKSRHCEVAREGWQKPLVRGGIKTPILVRLVRGHLAEQSLVGAAEEREQMSGHCMGETSSIGCQMDIACKEQTPPFAALCLTFPNCAIRLSSYASLLASKSANLIITD